MSIDYYEILGVERTATQDQIKKAYMKKARKAHPDAGGCKQDFQLIALSYNVLSDPDKRGRFDRGESVDESDPMKDVLSSLIQQAFGKSEEPMHYIKAEAREAIVNGKKSLMKNEDMSCKVRKKLDKLKKANEKTKNTIGLQFIVDTMNRFIATGDEANRGIQKSIELYESILLYVENIEYPSEAYQPFTRPTMVQFGGIRAPMSSWGGTHEP